MTRRPRDLISKQADVPGYIAPTRGTVEFGPRSEENRRLRGLLALTLVAIEEYLASPEAATKHMLAMQAACIKEALSPTTDDLVPPPT